MEGKLEDLEEVFAYFNEVENWPNPTLSILSLFEYDA